jgi:hypothetical protein
MESIKIYTRQQVLSTIQKCLGIIEKQQEQPMGSHNVLDIVFTQRELISQIYNAFLKQKSEVSSPFQQLKGDQGASGRKGVLLGAKSTSDTLLYSEEDIMWVVCNESIGNEKACFNIVQLQICHAVYLMSRERYSSSALWNQYVELAMQKQAQRGQNPLEYK